LINLVDIQDIITIQKSVTEEISNRHLKDFFFNILEEYDIQSDTYELFYVFSNQRKQYNIFLVKNEINKTNILIPYIFTYNYFSKKLLSSGVDLFITKDFFVLYINGNMECFKDNEETSTEEDIKIFLEKYIDMNIDNTYNISEEELELIKSKYTNNYKKIKQINKINSKNNIKLISFISIIILLAIFSINIKEEENNNLIIEEPVNKKVLTKLDIQVVLPIIKARVDNCILIENQWLKVGDTYNKFMLLNINDTYVEFNHNDTKYRIENDK